MAWQRWYWASLAAIRCRGRSSSSSGRRASRLKLLCWDGDGYWLATKRLAQGRFQAPLCQGSDGRPAAVLLSATEWQLLLDGIVVRDRVVLTRHGRGSGA